MTCADGYVDKILVSFRPHLMGLWFYDLSAFRRLACGKQQNAQNKNERAHVGLSNALK